MLIEEIGVVLVTYLFFLGCTSSHYRTKKMVQPA